MLAEPADLQTWVLGAPDVSNDDVQRVADALEEIGLVVQHDQPAMDQRVEVVIFVVRRERVDQAALERWLDATRHARTTVAVGLGCQPSFAADMIIQLPADDEISVPPQTRRRIGELVRNAGALIPSMTICPPAVRSRQHVTTPEELLAALRSDQRTLSIGQGVADRWIAQRPTTLNELRIRRLLMWARGRHGYPDTHVIVGPASGLNQQTNPMTLASALDSPKATRLITLRGRPGSGKSSQLRWCETYLCWQSLAGRQSGNTLPIGLNLSGHAVISNLTARQWTLDQWARLLEPMAGLHFDHVLEHESVLFLLDSFSPAPAATPEQRAAWQHEWKDFIHSTLLESPNNRVVTASRNHDPHAVENDENRQTVLEMKPLDVSDVVRLAYERNGAAARRLEIELVADRALVNVYANPHALVRYALGPPDDVPRSRGDIIASNFAHAIRREQRKDNHRLDIEALVPQLALAAIDETSSTRSISNVLAMMPLFKALGWLWVDALGAVGGPILEGDDRAPEAVIDRSSAERIGEYLASSSSAPPSRELAREAVSLAMDLGVLLHDEGQVRFAHSTYGDFCASLYLDDRQIIDRVAIPIGAFSNLTGERFDDPVSRAGRRSSLAMWPATGFEEIAERAIERNRLLLASLAHANPWLCVDQLVRYPSRYARQFLMADVVPTVRTELLARTVSDDVRERVLALDGLGSLSDLGLMGQRDLPHSEFELVEIPGRVWELAQPVPGDAVEEPRVLSVQLPRFDICRTPVSNPQFRSFVDDGGYFRQELWSAIGWQWREGRYPPHRMVDYWNDRQAHLPGERELIELLANGSISAMEAAGIHRFSKLTWDEVEVLVTRSISATIGGPAFWASDSDLAGPVRPVVGVSWYEACAYCEWLSRELDARVRLPTEWEWQAAAIFTRLGPNGSHRLADAEEAGPGPHTNTAELGLGSTNPIGSLSPDGEPLVDLHGNVFEWCIDPYGPVGGDRYVMKGGSWRRLPDRSTIRYRGQGHASLRNDDVGLRVVVE